MIKTLRLLLCLCVCVSANALHAQSFSSKSFVRTYGLSASDYGTWAIETADQGYLLSMNSPTQVPPNFAVGTGILKTDCLGELQWQHMYIANGESLFSTQVMESGGAYYVYGSTGSTLNNAQQYIAKFGPDGTLLVARFIRSSVSDLPARFLRASNGTWWLISTGDNNVGFEHICVTHLDANFNLIASFKYSLAQRELQVSSATFTTNQELLLCGDYSNGGTFRNGFVMRIGVNGDLRWFTSLRDAYDVKLTDIVSDEAGYSFASGYVFNQATGVDALCVKFNVLGNEVGQVEVNMSEDDRLRAITKRGSELLLLGDFGTFDDRNAFWMRINSTTSAVSPAIQLDYGNPYTNYPYNVVPASGNSWLFTGDFVKPNGTRDAALVRLDAYFQLPCNTLVVDPFSHSVGNLVEGTESILVQPIQSTVTTADFTEVNLTYTSSSVCGKYTPTAAATFEVTEDCPLSCVQFTDQSLCDPQSWSWSFPGGEPATSTEQNPVVCYNSAGEKEVTLLVSNVDGSSSTSLTLTILNDCPLIIPNTFSPNGDGINDEFEITGLKTNSILKIFDRWGTLVFSSSAYKNNWSGKIQAEEGVESGNRVDAGVYFYVLESPNGVKKNGYIQLVR